MSTAWQDDRRDQAGSVVRQLYTPAMETRNCFDQGQSQSGTRRAAGSIEPPETAQGLLAIGLGDARAAILDLDADLAGAAGESQRDLAAAGAVLERIVDQIGDGLGHQLA